MSVVDITVVLPESDSLVVLVVVVVAVAVPSESLSVPEALSLSVPELLSLSLALPAVVPVVVIVDVAVPVEEPDSVFPAESSPLQATPRQATRGIDTIEVRRAMGVTMPGISTYCIHELSASTYKICASSRGRAARVR
ncbi:MAG: hypothetical protein R3A79_29290 [Nannocystaceae bacterium]